MIKLLGCARWCEKKKCEFLALAHQHHFFPRAPRFPPHHGPASDVRADVPHLGARGCRRRRARRGVVVLVRPLPEVLERIRKAAPLLLLRDAFARVAGVGGRLHARVG